MCCKDGSPTVVHRKPRSACLYRIAGSFITSYQLIATPQLEIKSANLFRPSQFEVKCQFACDEMGPGLEIECELDGLLPLCTYSVRLAPNPKSPRHTPAPALNLPLHHAHSFLAVSAAQNDSPNQRNRSSYSSRARHWSSIGRCGARSRTPTDGATCLRRPPSLHCRWCRKYDCRKSCRRAQARLPSYSCAISIAHTTPAWACTLTPSPGLLSFSLLE